MHEENGNLARFPLGKQKFRAWGIDYILSAVGGGGERKEFCLMHIAERYCILARNFGIADLDSFVVGHCMEPTSNT